MKKFVLALFLALTMVLSVGIMTALAAESSVKIAYDETVELAYARGAVGVDVTYGEELPTGRRSVTVYRYSGTDEVNTDITTDRDPNNITWLDQFEAEDELPANIKFGEVPSFAIAAGDKVSVWVNNVLVGWSEVEVVNYPTLIGYVEGSVKASPNKVTFGIKANIPNGEEIVVLDPAGEKLVATYGDPVDGVYTVSVSGSFANGDEFKVSIVDLDGEDVVVTDTEGVKFVSVPIVFTDIAVHNFAPTGVSGELKITAILPSFDLEPNTWICAILYDNKDYAKLGAWAGTGHDWLTFIHIDPASSIDGIFADGIFTGLEDGKEYWVTVRLDVNKVATPVDQGYYESPPFEFSATPGVVSAYNTITWNLNGGYFETTPTVSYLEGGSFELAKAAKASMNFVGWYTDVTLQNAVAYADYNFAEGNKVFYAKYEPIAAETVTAITVVKPEIIRVGDNKVLTLQDQNKKDIVDPTRVNNISVTSSSSSILSVSWDSATGVWKYKALKTGTVTITVKLAGKVQQTISMTVSPK